MARAQKAQAQQMEMLQANYASVVGLLETAEGEKKQLLLDAAGLQQRLDAAEAELHAARHGAIEKEAAAEEMAIFSTEKDAALAASRAELAQLQLEVEALRSSSHAAEVSGAAAEVRAAEAERQAMEAERRATAAQEQEQEQARAAAATEGRLRHAEEMARAREASHAAREANQIAGAADAAFVAVEALGDDLAALEAALAEMGPKAVASEEAAARAEAADLSVTRMREETRRAVGAERQRVAGMLYKEALQTHTLEEQAGQIDELITEVAGAKQLAAERDRLVAERDQISAELQALAESRSEHVQSILNLDDQLAIEQQTRQEAQLLLQQTQAALAQRAAREAEATKRVQQAENTLAAYKVSYRELRSQLGGALHNRRPAEAQTDWQAINLPLPAPAAPA